MELKIGYREGKGLVRVLPLGAGPLQLLGFSLLLMNERDEVEIQHLQSELVLVLMSGRCSVQVGERQFKGLSRTSVFKERATAVYAPANSPCTVVAIDDTEIAVVSAEAKLVSVPKLVKRGDVKVRHVGQYNWYREVHDVVDYRVEAEKLLVGETYSPPGNWSSFPPHKHDRDALPTESKQEEFYHFRLNPPTGFGMQRVYTDDGEIDETIVVHDRDTVVIPRGYHPVVSAPGYQLYYLWALAGEGRQLAASEDPLHSWVGKSVT